MIPRVFVITDRRLAPRLVETVTRVLDQLPLRAAAVVLREKDLPVRELVALGRALREATWRRKALFVVSGRFDVALACCADGVHLGGEAPAFDAVRAVVPKELLVGVSLHGDEAPCAGASYALLSPVFATRSKPGAVPLGLEGLRAGVARAGGVPIVALGGVDATNAAACLDAGAAAVALRGRFMGAGGPIAGRKLARLARRIGP